MAISATVLLVTCNSLLCLLPYVTAVDTFKGKLVRYKLVDSSIPGYNVTYLREKRSETKGESSVGSPFAYSIASKPGTVSGAAASSQTTSSGAADKPSHPSLQPTPSSTLPDSLLTDTTECLTEHRCILITDDNQYYTVKYVLKGSSYWIDANSLGVSVIVHESLENAHRIATTFSLGFDFFFYGHSLKSMLVTTGGFLYMNDFAHGFLTATQYIAPLMANFDTSIGSNDSKVIIADNGTLCIIQWNKIFIADHISFGNVRTVYEYDQVVLDKQKIVSHSAVVFTHKRSCQFLKTCLACTTEKLPFNCSWCEKLDRCSDSFDRHRQEWLDAGCLKAEEAGYSRDCSGSMENTRSGLAYTTGGTIGESTLRGLVAVASTMAIASLAIFAAWLYYAYSHPESRAGQWLIENRPSRLMQRLNHWRKSTDIRDRYTVEIQALPSESISGCSSL